MLISSLRKKLFVIFLAISAIPFGVVLTYFDVTKKMSFLNIVEIFFLEISFIFLAITLSSFFGAFFIDRVIKKYSANWDVEKKILINSNSNLLQLIKELNDANSKITLNLDRSVNLANKVNECFFGITNVVDSFQRNTDFSKKALDNCEKRIDSIEMRMNEFFKTNSNEIKFDASNKNINDLIIKEIAKNNECKTFLKKSSEYFSMLDVSLNKKAIVIEAQEEEMKSFFKELDKLKSSVSQSILTGEKAREIATTINTKFNNKKILSELNLEKDIIIENINPEMQSKLLPKQMKLSLVKSGASEFGEFKRASGENYDFSDVGSTINIDPKFNDL